MSRKENLKFNGAKETAGVRKRMSHNMLGSMKVIFIQFEPLQEIVEKLDPITSQKSCAHKFPSKEAVWLGTFPKDTCLFSLLKVYREWSFWW